MKKHTTAALGLCVLLLTLTLPACGRKKAAETAVISESYIATAPAEKTETTAAEVPDTAAPKGENTKSSPIAEKAEETGETLTASPAGENEIPAVEHAMGTEVYSFDEAPASSTAPTNTVTPTPAAAKPSGTDMQDLDYLSFSALSAEEQYDYIQSFDSNEDFLRWYNEVKAAYEDSLPVMTLDAGAVVDVG